MERGGARSGLRLAAGQVQSEHAEGAGEGSTGAQQKPDRARVDQSRGQAMEARLVPGLRARDQADHGPLVAGEHGQGVRCK